MAKPPRIITEAVEDFAVKPVISAFKKLTGKKAAPAAKKKPTPRGIVNTPDLRVFPTEQAVSIARGEPHLMQDASGQYIGAPRGVMSPEDIAVMRTAFDKDVVAGAGGADWYTRARDANVEWAGQDPARQRLLAQEEALWSAQSTPDTNLNFALQGHNAYEMGTPLNLVRTGQQARTYRTARDMGREIPLGKKTGVYGQHLDPTSPHATTGTNDIWHARGFGYTNPNGSLFSRALTPQEHRFLDYETMLAVDRANKSKLAGRTDWQAHEIQAAPWVAGKGRALAVKGRKAEAEGIGEASKTYPDFANKYTAFGTYEQTPGAMTGHLPDLVAGAPETRAAYAADPRSSWAQEGRDVIYDALGLYQRPTLSATGLYTPPGGVMEVNPANVARPLVGIKDFAVDPASRKAMTLGEGLRAYIDAQGAGAWNKPILNAPAGKMGSVFTPLERQLNPDEMLKMKALGEKYNLGDVIDTGQGVTLTSFAKNAPSGKEVGKALKRNLTSDIEGLLGNVEPRRALLDTGYIPMFEVKGAKPGSGKVTRNLQKLVKEFGVVPAQKLSKSEAVRAKALANMQRDAELAAKTGQPIRKDIQRARELLGQGGLEALFNALKRGEALPVLAGSAFAVPALTRRDE